MPTVAETASAFRNRFRFQEPSVSTSEVDPSRVASPALFKSASKENIFQSTAMISSIRERDDQEILSGSSVQSFELQEDPSFWKDHNVQVVIRIRPLSSSEISLQGYNRCVKQDSCQSITWTGHPESRFTFDHVADENVSQEKLFKVAGLPMVDNCMGGYNSCMFAYGQTGSGKTHTMLGDIEGGTRRHNVNCGMTPRVFDYLFSRIQKEKEARKDEKLRFTCKCSFLEIYNEQILDLLEPSSTNLQIREDAKKGVHVENLMEFEVSSARDVIQQLVQGAANRKVAATNMNRASSRSHSVFTCIIESKWEAQGVIHHRFARLNLVDLAGSERQKSSGAEGERLKEATNINKSLSTLGLVIMNLVNISNGKSQHVPYRDSKLTFLLQDSLGGNSKTLIIANISPSNCCALETLSTLKFAQRAKYIRNNAIVNEDASGDVLAMRMQIQQLKKEVTRLRAIANGGAENQETDNWSICLGSPGSFKWDALQAPLSPLASERKTAKKRDLETALVGAFRREQDKEIAIKAMVAENQAAMQLTKQREEEIQSLKMRLRFREAGIKRVEALAAGKISAETHLLQEKNELLKEIEVLRNQVDRNQEVTRFAMENLRLKEELRRLQSFYEDGERDMLHEQIAILQDKLLEALDWKLMHEKDPSIIQKENLDPNALICGEDKQLVSGQDPPLPVDFSAISEENEILRVQAIQNQREVEALRKNLNFCLEAKEKLERRVDDLALHLEEERKISCSLKEAGQLQTADSISLRPNDTELNNQMELKTMVDAIAAASQREAEAHETAINLAKENEELRRKLRVLIEDNNKLIELYENAVSEANNKATSVLEVEKTQNHDLGSVDFTESGQESYVLETKNIELLERQLQEMHEENEKLMGLYETAMHERDEFKRMLLSNEQNNMEVKKEMNYPEKLVEVDEERVYPNPDEEIGSGNPMKLIEVDEEMVYPNPDEEIGSGNREIATKPVKMAGDVSEEELNLAKKKLDLAEDKLLQASKALNFFGYLEKFDVKFDTLSKEIETVEHGAWVKQQEISDLKAHYTKTQENKTMVDNKLHAVKRALLNFCTSDSYWEQREAQARARVDTASCFVKKKNEELTGYQASREEIKINLSKAQQLEITLRNNVDCLKLKLNDAEVRRKETEKVLFLPDNSDKSDTSEQSINSTHLGKAAELLKSEEERIKLVAEMKQRQSQLVSLQKEIYNLKFKLESLETAIQSIQAEIMSYSSSIREAELGLQNVIRERESLREMREEGRRELEKLIILLQQCVFEAGLKEEEVTMCERELEMETRMAEALRARKTEEIERKRRALAEGRWICGEFGAEGETWSVCEKVEEELGDVHRSVLEARSLLVSNSR